MALSKTENSKSYVATGLRVFDFNIPYFDNADIVVKRQNADGTISVLAQRETPIGANQYSVVATGGNPENGATITLGADSTNGLTYTIERVVAYTQQYDLQEGATIDPTALNKALDRAVAQNQQQQSVFDRTLEFPITDASTVTYNVGTATERAGKALGFDTDGSVRAIEIGGSFSVDPNKGLAINGSTGEAKINTGTLEFDGNGNINVKNGGIGTNQIANGSIEQSDLGTNCVTTDKINNNAVTTSKIGTFAVTTAKVADGAITGVKIASGAVGGSQLGDNVVTSSKILNGSVDTSEIADDAVTNAKIANNAVQTPQILDNAVTHDKYQDIDNLRVIGNVSGSTNSPTGILIDTDLSTVQNHTSVASAKAVKDYVDDRVSLSPNIAIARKSDIQSLNSVTNATWYTISNLAPSITVNKTDSIYKVTADINFGADSFEDMIGFKVMFKVNSGSYTDFDLNSQGTRFSVHSGFNGHDGASGCTMAGHSFNVYKDAISGISVGDTVTFQLYIASIAGATNDFKINRAMYESGGYSNYLTGKTVLAAEEIYQS